MEKENFMENFETINKENLKIAYNIINELNIENVFKEYDYKANLIGSVPTKLLMNNLDIDYHVYSNNMNINDIYKLIGVIATNKRIIETSFFNFFDSEDKSYDCHLHYLDNDNNKWRIDIIFIKNNSPYVGKAENIRDIINNNITQDQRNKILRIKNELYKNNIEFHGIEVYKAVIEFAISTTEDFIKWKGENANIKLWEINNQK
jgi:hypothetical protein